MGYINYLGKAIKIHGPKIEEVIDVRKEPTVEDKEFMFKRIRYRGSFKNAHVPITPYPQFPELM